MRRSRIGCLVPEGLSAGTTVGGPAVAAVCSVLKTAGSSVAGTGNFSSPDGSGDAASDGSISHCFAIFFSTNNTLNTISTPINPKAIVKTA